MPELRLDELVLATATAALSEEKRYQSVAIVESINRTTPGFLHALKGKADFLVLIETGASPDVIFRTNQFMRGVGVIQRSMFGTKPRALAYAALKGELFDLSIGESLGTKSSTVFMDASMALESGPKIPTVALEETKNSVMTRTQGAVLGVLSALGLR